MFCKFYMKKTLKKDTSKKLHPVWKRPEDRVLYTLLQKNSLRAREKDPWSRALSALPQDLTLIPSSHVYPEASSQYALDTQL